jgi:tRNA pseudouridine55 synthase
VTVDSGLVVVDKPSGLTSHDVVARVRRMVGTRRVGHAGTLDPMATGVLVVGVERATRLLGHLTLTEKAYDATIRLGAGTTTDDAEGEALAVSQHRSPSELSEAEVRATLQRFVGEVEQVPSSVSAIKVDGRRAHQRVRDGEDLTLKPRKVVIRELLVHELRHSGEWLDVHVSLRCSSGTYVRAIARDTGQALEVGGHLTRLRRTAVGPFTLALAHTLDELGESVALVPIAAAARQAFPAYELDEASASAVRVGRSLSMQLDGLTAMFDPAGDFLALYEPRGTSARPVAVFV